jgi:hypothetical protein
MLTGCSLHLNHIYKSMLLSSINIDIIQIILPKTTILLLRHAHRVAPSARFLLLRPGLCYFWGLGGASGHRVEFGCLVGFQQFVSELFVELVIGQIGRFWDMRGFCLKELQSMVYFGCIYPEFGCQLFDCEPMFHIFIKCHHFWLTQKLLFIFQALLEGATGLSHRQQRSQVRHKPIRNVLPPGTHKKGRFIGILTHVLEEEV